MPGSLRRQLLVWVLVPLIVLLAINSVFAYLAAWKSADQAHDRTLLGSALAIAERVELAGTDIVVDLPYVALEMLGSSVHDRVYYRVTGSDGELITGYGDIAPPPAHLRKGGGTLFYDDRYRGEAIRVVALYRQLYDEKVKGPVLVQVAETTESRKALSWDILFDAMQRQVLLIAIAVILVAFGLQRALRPLLRLRDDISAREQSNYAPIPTRDVPQEVRPLIDAINLHTNRVQDLVSAQARFTADAAHQLRTPLTLLNTQAEYALRQHSLEAMRGVVEELHRNTNQTVRLATQLLTLARSEPTAVAAHGLAEVDLAQLARETTFEWAAAAVQKQIDLEYAGSDEGLWIPGHHALLHELLSNLIDNAIRYTQSGGHVTVRVSHASGQALLEIEDDGPGIAPAERERVFERFYRVLGTSADGCGLGLAIVREICKSHGASIALADPPGKRGLAVQIRFTESRSKASPPRLDGRRSEPTPEEERACSLKST